MPVERLGVRRQMPVLALVGTTRDLGGELAERLEPLLCAVVEVAADARAAIVTGGTDAGVFQLLGQAVSTAPRSPSLRIGVAPDDLVAGRDKGASGLTPIDPHLSALVRVPGGHWGDETLPLSRLVDAVAGAQPAVVLLVGGGQGTRAELLEHLSRGRSVVVVESSGRLADEIAAGLPDDPTLRGLIDHADVRIVGIDDVEGVRNLLANLLHERQRVRSALLSVVPRLRFRAVRPDPLLSRDAARRYPSLLQRMLDADRIVFRAFEACDVEAQEAQYRHRWFTILAIVGGLLTTVFGAAQAWLRTAMWPGLLVATLGAATSALTALARREGSLRAYLDARIRAERLRSLYFEYLAGGPEPNEEVHQRQVRALEIRTVEIASEPVIS